MFDLETAFDHQLADRVDLDSARLRHRIAHERQIDETAHPCRHLVAHVQTARFGIDELVQTRHAAIPDAPRLDQIVALYRFDMLQLWCKRVVPRTADGAGHVAHREIPGE